MSATGSRADVSVVTDKPGKQLPWSPPSRDEFTARLEEVLAQTEDRQYRMNIGLQCWAFMNRTWYRRTNASHARTQWSWFRYAAAVIPVVAAGAGGSLVGQLHGSAAIIVGWVALVGGLAGAAINAVRPAVEYGVDLIKAAEFERLYWDVFNYAIVELPASDATAIPVKLNSFSERMREISVISGSSTATSS
jgi:hypothetical protein